MNVVQTGAVPSAPVPAGTGGWEIGGRTLSADHERIARAAFDGAGGTDAFDLAVITGSMVAGHGHGRSDLDLHVVPTPGTVVDVRARPVEGIFVQFNLVTPQMLAEIAEVFGSYRLTPTDRSQLQAMRRRFKPASRLAFGRPLHVAERLESTFREVDPEVMRRLVLTDCGTEVGRNAEDALGALTDFDALIAWQSACSALRYAAEGAMAARGDVYTGESFFWRRARNLDPGGEIARMLWGLLEPPVWGAPPELVRPRVEAAVETATWLVSEAQLTGWYAPVAACPTTPVTSRSGRRRNRYANVLRLGETVAIVSPDRGFRCTEDTARAWLDIPTGDGPGISRLLDMGLLEPVGSDGTGRR